LRKIAQYQKDFNFVTKGKKESLIAYPMRITGYYNKNNIMKKHGFFTGLILLSFTMLMLAGCTTKEVSPEPETKVTKRVGMVVKFKPEYMDEYKKLHADSNPGVRDLLVKANMTNFSIFMIQLDDGNWYEFGYYEYTGTDFEADMAALDKEQRNIDWLEVCDPMQVPLEGYDGWAEMELVYFNK